ncbi:MAG: hypothetical protein IT207_00850 [Fimbriimonadaceae bacterium]|nr:hypothetical protein [Fimbriimonadaceae bacterium]
MKPVLGRLAREPQVRLGGGGLVRELEAAVAGVEAELGRQVARGRVLAEDERAARHPAHPVEVHPFHREVQVVLGPLAVLRVVVEQRRAVLDPPARDDHRAGAPPQPQEGPLPDHRRVRGKVVRESPLDARAGQPETRAARAVELEVHPVGVEPERPAHQVVAEGLRRVRVVPPPAVPALEAGEVEVLAIRPRALEHTEDGVRVEHVHPLDGVADELARREEDAERGVPCRRPVGVVALERKPLDPVMEPRRAPERDDAAVGQAPNDC